MRSFAYSSVRSNVLRAAATAVAAIDRRSWGRFVTSWRKPVPSVAEAVGDGNPGVGEEQLRRVLGVHADLLEVAAALEAGRVALDDDERHPAVALARVGLDRGDHEVGVDAVRDERLRPVDDVVVAVAHSCRRHRRQVGADARLGHRDRRDQLTGTDAGQPALLLFVVRQVEEVRQADVVVEGQAETRRVDIGVLDLLGDHLVEPEVLDPAATELLRHVDAEEPVRAGRPEERAVHDPRGFPFVPVGNGLAGEERAERVPERLMGVVEQGALHRPQFYHTRILTGARRPTSEGFV